MPGAAPDPEDFGPARAALAVAGLAGIVVFAAIAFDPIAALAGAAVAAAASRAWIRSGQERGTLPSTWEAWYASAFEVSPLSTVLQLGGVAVVFSVVAFVQDDSVRAAALGGLGGGALPFAVTGLVLVRRFRARHES